MKTVIVVALLMLIVSLSAQADIMASPQEIELDNGQVAFLMDGAPTNWQNLPWSDKVLHSAPVMERGLVPVKVRPGYEVVPLAAYDWYGRKIYCYVGWTSRTWQGKKIWMKVRPNEVVEARMTVRVKVSAMPSITAEMWGWATGYDETDMRWIRCGNPGGVAAFKFVPIYTRTVQLPAPPPIERRIFIDRPYPKQVIRIEIVAPAMPMDLATPHAERRIFVKRGILPQLAQIAAAYVGRTRVSIVQNAPVNTTSSAAASSSSSSSSSATNNTDVDVSQQQQQQQGVSVTTPSPVDP